jgi:hypothetical protein
VAVVIFAANKPAIQPTTTIAALVRAYCIAVGYLSAHIMVFEPLLSEAFSVLRR